MQITEKAYAKINLALENVGIREDGYHELKMIMVPIDLFDILSFEFANKNEVASNIKIEDNIILKAVILFQNYYQVNEKVRVILDKKIPIGAGLGGGSADASAVIRGLNRLYKLNKPLKELEELVLKLGSDTLFCLYNKPAYVCGRGDVITFIDKPQLDDLYIFTSSINVSTKEVFLNSVINKHNADFNKLLVLLKENNIEEFSNNTYNDLLIPAINTYKKLEIIYDYLKNKYGNIHMSGSGSTFFIIGKIDSEMIDNEKMVQITKIKLL